MYKRKRNERDSIQQTNFSSQVRENERTDYLQLCSISVRVSNAILEADANPCSRSIAQIAISKRRRLTEFMSAILNRLSRAVSQSNLRGSSGERGGRGQGLGFSLRDGKFFLEFKTFRVVSTFNFYQCLLTARIFPNRPFQSSVKSNRATFWIN